MFEIESKNPDEIIISTKKTAIKINIADSVIDANLPVGKITGPGEFEIGDMLRHPKFGVGMLIAQDEKTMTVMFDDYGEKKLGKGFVKMEKVQ